MNYSRATARRNRIEGDITVPAFALTARRLSACPSTRTPRTLSSAADPGSPPESIPSGPLIIWAELGIIFVGAERDAPAEGRTLPSRPPGHCPETAKPITECDCKSRAAAPDPPYLSGATDDPPYLSGATDFAGARVCPAEPGFMWPPEVCRLAAGLAR